MLWRAPLEVAPARPAGSSSAGSASATQKRGATRRLRGGGLPVPKKLAEPGSSRRRFETRFAGSLLDPQPRGTSNL